ncbi:recombinase family protein [Ruminiclostridium papyrosolvens]|uniref:Resolvase n=1 Tax=Ruminiclostridium papyrosolvens C7 TaxID=1330534 RepID=U4QWW5_9FIRM|nr:recombinase family protein [Ruminiclostridium papyrosolvens]EPR07975.1 resolvase [Ruminiclostridium papyrosolvens C7]
MKKVTVIEASSESKAADNRKIRVCAYCRVSSMHKEQQNSFEAQASHYTKYIQSNSQWEFAGIYSDEGISGTKKEIRPEFMRLINDCENGRIDMVITKSISRFARNTADCIETIRKLKSLGVTVYFEKENINSMSQESELILSVLSSLAQEEAASMSSNIRWANQRRYKQGKFQIATAKFMGYDKDGNGDLVINQAEAEIVKRIFREYIGGKGSAGIARTLNEENIPTITGTKWYGSTIRRMLGNEKYCGDALLQKTITADSVTFKRKSNKGELPQYYIKNNHEPIISREDFERVKELIEIRKKKQGIDEEVIKKMRKRYPLTGKIICGNCGNHYKRSIYNTSNKYRSVVYVCSSTEAEKIMDCNARPVMQKGLHQAFINMSNRLYSNWRTLLLPYRTYLKKLVQSTADRTEIYNIDNQIIELAEQESMQKILLAKGSIEPALFNKNINETTAKINEIKARKQAISTSIVNQDILLAETEKSIEFIKNYTYIDEFDEDCFNAIVKDIVVKSRNNLCFRLKNGMELDEFMGGEDDVL